MVLSKKPSRTYSFSSGLNVTLSPDWELALTDQSVRLWAAELLPYCTLSQHS